MRYYKEGNHYFSSDWLVGQYCDAYALHLYLMEQFVWISSKINGHLPWRFELHCYPCKLYYVFLNQMILKMLLLLLNIKVIKTNLRCMLNNGFKSMLLQKSTKEKSKDLWKWDLLENKLIMHFSNMDLIKKKHLRNCWNDDLK